MQNGLLHVSGLTAGEAWNVYDISGRLAHQRKATGKEATVPLTMQ
jgi:hypothetical protein